MPATLIRCSSSSQSELLLDRLILICSSIIRQYVTITNVCSILSDASYYNADHLVTSLQGYIARNLETLLESNMLSDLPVWLVRQLASYVRDKQLEKSSRSRSRVWIDDSLKRNAEWLKAQDIPEPFVSFAATRSVHKQSPKMSPLAVGVGAGRKGKQTMGMGSAPSPPQIDIGAPRAPVVARKPSGSGLLQTIPLPANAPGDDIFQMDDIEKELPLVSELSSSAIPIAASDVRPWGSQMPQQALPRCVMLLELSMTCV